jgi:hypothetical protein
MSFLLPWVRVRSPEDFRAGLHAEATYRAVQIARAQASGTEVMLVGSGGSIPIVPAGTAVGAT